MANMIEDYLTTLKSLLPMSKQRRTRILQEIEDHLLEGWSHERERGVLPEEALQRVLARFGRPEEIAHAFTEQAIVSTKRQARLIFLAGLVFCFLLICSTLFHYPAIIGSFTGDIGYSCLCLLILCAYGWIGVTNLQSTAALPALRQQVRVGLWSTIGFAIAYILMCLIESELWSQGALLYSGQRLLAVDHLVNSLLVTAPFIFWLIFTLIGSGSAASHTRHISTGSMVGLWSGLIMALAIALICLVVNYALMGILLPTSWSHDPICQGSNDLVTCELGDTMGGVTSALLTLPLLGAGVGTFGGVFSKGRDMMLSRHNGDGREVITHEYTRKQPTKNM